MKKVIALMLCLLMVMSMAACGSQSAATEESSAPTEQNEQNETVTPPTEETEQPEETSDPEETSEPEETQAPEPAFDTSWAGDEYVMPIPEPPFAYEILDEHESVTVAVHFTNVKDVTYESILDYCKELKNAGFTENLREMGEKGNSVTYYLFSASDASGNSVYLSHDGGSMGLGVTLSSSQNETAEEPAEETAANDPVDISSLSIPELPNEEWVIKENENGGYNILCDEISYSSLSEYVDELVNDGYSIDSSGANGEGYSWTLLNMDVKNSISLNYFGDVTSDGSCQFYVYNFGK